MSAVDEVEDPGNAVGGYAPALHFCPHADGNIVQLPYGTETKDLEPGQHSTHHQTHTQHLPADPRLTPSHYNPITLPLITPPLTSLFCYVLFLCVAACWFQTTTSAMSATIVKRIGYV